MSKLPRYRLERMEKILLLVANDRSLITISIISYLLSFSWTITVLYLHENKIGDAGAQQLADALKINKVIYLSS